METFAKRHLGGFDQIGPSLRAGLVHSAESAPEKSVMVHGRPESKQWACFSLSGEEGRDTKNETKRSKLPRHVATHRGGCRAQPCRLAMTCHRTMVRRRFSPIQLLCD